MLGAPITWTKQQWQAITSIAGGPTATGGVVWFWGGKIACGRIAKVEDRLDVQEAIHAAKSKTEEIEIKLSVHERECLKTRRENGNRLTRLEAKVDRQRDKLNRIEGLIEGLREAIRS